MPFSSSMISNRKACVRLTFLGGTLICRKVSDNHWICKSMRGLSMLSPEQEYGLLNMLCQNVSQLHILALCSAEHVYSRCIFTCGTPICRSNGIGKEVAGNMKSLQLQPVFTLRLMLCDETRKNNGEIKNIHKRAMTGWNHALTLTMLKMLDIMKSCFYWLPTLPGPTFFYAMPFMINTAAAAIPDSSALPSPRKLWRYSFLAFEIRRLNIRNSIPMEDS
ncbi:hypothetical protein B0H34DRAFT_372957 [Crassisporium funariophilum]|nr:hypothetical protein B0H34DRAFT_372957 [Crassisporium funariophilum]